jgi:hypothetical protein
MVSSRKAFKNHLYAMGLAFLAVAALGAGAAASASAAKPEFVLKSGSFPVGFTSTGGAATWETTSGETLSCTSITDGGAITGTKTGSVTLTFKGCTTTMFGFPISCKSSGRASGEVQTNLLATHLYSDNTRSKVLEDLAPASGSNFAQFECAGLGTVVWTGQLLGEFPTTNTFLHSTSLIFKQTKGVQAFSAYENETGELVSAYLQTSKNGGTPVRMGIEATDGITFEGVRELEITR